VDAEAGSAPAVSAGLRPAAGHIDTRMSATASAVAGWKDGEVRRPSVAEVIALQRTAGNRAVSRLVRQGSGVPTAVRARPLQRNVRIDGGKKRVDENYYKNGEGYFIGLRFLIPKLIDDPVKRVFESATELDDYALGLTDHIGDVETKKAGTFWLRLPKDQLTVIGESHDSEDGNVEDVILGLGTGRFKYEPYHDAPSAIPLTDTEKQLKQTVSQYRVTHLDARKYQLNFDPSKYEPSLENIVVKALFSVSTVLKDFIRVSPHKREDETWKKRPSNRDYSWGERQALYFSIAVHIAADIAPKDFGPVTAIESAFVKSERKLKDTYLKHQTELDAFMKAKDADELIAFYELIAPSGYANLPALEEFALAYQSYAEQYVVDLGASTGNQDLVKVGTAMLGAGGASWSNLNAAREAIMWQKVQEARAGNYLLVGMGDAHHQSLKKKLDAAGIPHFFVEDELVRQKKEIEKAWVP
jgi:hypothetical protein